MAPEQDHTDDFIPLQHLLGQVAALAMGIIVLGVNYQQDHPLPDAAIAGVKQYVCSAISALISIDIQQRINAKNDREEKPSLLQRTNPVTIPSLISTVLAFATHTIRGTPETLLSTLPTAVMAPFGYWYLQWRRKRA